MGICASKKDSDIITQPTMTFFDFQINDIDGNLIKLSKF